MIFPLKPPLMGDFPESHVWSGPARYSRCWDVEQCRGARSCHVSYASCVNFRNGWTVAAGDLGPVLFAGRGQGGRLCTNRFNFGKMNMICDYTKYNYCIYDYICNICVRVCHAWSVVSLVTESMSIAVMNFAQAWFEKEPRCLCLPDAIRFDPGWDRRCTWWMFHRVTVCHRVWNTYPYRCWDHLGSTLRLNLTVHWGIKWGAEHGCFWRFQMCNFYWAKGTSTRRLRGQFLATTSRHYSFRYWENACPTKMFCWPVVSLQNRRLGAESVRMCLMSLWKHGNPFTGFGRWAVYWKWSKVQWTLVQHSAHQTQMFTAVVLRSGHFQRTAMLTLWNCWGSMWWPAAAWSCGSSGSRMTRFTYSFTNRRGDNH